jgi:hypothetical protein
VKDNGIGMAASRQWKERNGKPHNAVAMELTKQRLALLPQNGSQANTIQVVDTAPGTTITINLVKIS